MMAQVEVARLTLELKEAQMQRDQEGASKEAAQQTINTLQVGLTAHARTHTERERERKGGR